MMLWSSARAVCDIVNGSTIMCRKTSRADQLRRLKDYVLERVEHVRPKSFIKDHTEGSDQWTQYYCQTPVFLRETSLRQ